VWLEGDCGPKVATQGSFPSRKTALWGTISLLIAAIQSNPFRASAASLTRKSEPGPLGVGSVAGLGTV
jgi:hypothetical protein